MYKYRFGVSYNEEIPDRDTAYGMWQEVEDEMWREVIGEFKTSGKSHQNWERIKAQELIRTWNSFVQHGKANREMVEKFEELMLYNISRLYVNNALCGHDQFDGWDYVKDYLEDEFSDDEKQRYYDYYSVHPEEGDIISDYGLPKLQALIADMLTAPTPERKLKVIDRMLNICHMRGDLAAFFVEGGSDTLNKLAGKEEEVYV